LHERQWQAFRGKSNEGKDEIGQDVKPEDELHRFHHHVERARSPGLTHGVMSKEYRIIPMKTALTGSMMLRSIMTMRRSSRGGSGAGISNSAGSRFSHWAWLGFIIR
jgi:hypothetical protein